MDTPGVPKFTSFKPKTSKSTVRSNEVVKDTGEGKTSTREDKRSSHRRRDSDRKRRAEPASGEGARKAHRVDEHELHHRPRPQSSHPRTRGEDRTQDVDYPPRQRSTALVEAGESDLFIIDRRGDSKNVEYGSLHRYSVPAYRRFGAGNLIGLSNRTKIDRESSNDKEICLMRVGQHGGERGPRLLASSHAKGKETRLRLIVPKDTGRQDFHDDDYVELQPSKKRKRGSESPIPTQDYRSIEGKAKPTVEDNDTCIASDSDSAPNRDDNDSLLARKHNAVLSKQAKAEPLAIDVWEELVAHQANLICAKEELSSFTTSERRTLADLRLSILNEASAHIVKGSPGRERLLLAMIEEGKILWDSTKLAAKWRDVLQEVPSSILIWTKYLDYVQDMSYGSFKFDTCKDSYLQCFRMLQRARNSATGPEIDGINRLRLYVLLRFTILTREAGYEELAMGVWQALLECHCSLPESLRTATLKDRLDALEDFWDSEVPRFGEEDAQGWAKYAQGNPTSTRRSPAPVTVGEQADGFIASVNAEYCFRGRRVLSTTADSAEINNDPYRYVMFSDMRDVIDDIGLEFPRNPLFAGFLHFMGLRQPCWNIKELDTQTWQCDPHLGNISTHWAGNQEFARPLRPAEVKLQCIREFTGALFDDAFDDFAQFDECTGHHELRDFLSRALETFVSLHPHDDALAEYLVAFKLKLMPEEAPRVAKRLLKQHPSSLRLYNAYAQVVAKTQSPARAGEIWSTALRMRATLSQACQDDAVFLWHSRLMLQIQDNDNLPTAIDDLLSIASAHNDSRSSHLRTQRELESSFDRTQLANQPEHAALYTDLLAWLTYLTHHDRALDAALLIYRKHATALTASPAATPGLELLHQCKARLITFHMDQQRAYRPQTLQAELEPSLQLFPHNSILLDLHARLASQDRLRSLLAHGPAVRAPPRPTVVQVSHRLAGELARVGEEAAGATANNVRAVFRAALTSAESGVKHAPALWMLWLRWEYSRAVAGAGPARAKAMQAAKQVFLDGLRHIPWHKHWVVMGIKWFGEEGTSRAELSRWYDVLMERGLRIRFDAESCME